MNLWADSQYPTDAIGHVAQVRLGKMLQPLPGDRSDVEVPYLRAGHLSMLDAIDDFPTMYATARDITQYGIRSGDLLVAEGGDPGQVAFVGSSVPTPCIIQNSLHRLRLERGDIRFLRYGLECVYGSGWLNVLCNKSTFGHLTREKLVSLKVPQPKPKIQRAIADFLDAETAQIDQLIEARQRMIALWRERFLAELHWRIFGQQFATRLARVADILPGYAFSSESFQQGPNGAIRLLRGVNVEPDQIHWDDTVSIGTTALEQFVRYQMRVGDIVIGMDRPLIANGMRVARTTEADVPSLLVQRVARIRARASADQGYLAMALRSHAFEHHLVPVVTGVSVPHIIEDQIGSFTVPLPDIGLQKQIARALEKSDKRTRDILDACQRQITILQERRHALIAAAVTGQIRIPGAA
jgi:type I restriction enzyme, S subunit